MLWTVIAYLALHLTLLFTVAPPEELIEADSLTFHRMATHFLEEGGFAEQTRQPLYPILMAGALAFGDTVGLRLLTGLQVLMLLLTGFVAWRLARDWLPENPAAAVFALVVLNPNAAGAAHWPLADTLHALLFTVAIWALLRFARGGGLVYAVVTGAMTALAGLTRPETTYLLYLLLPAFVVVGLVASPRRPWPAGIRAGLVAMIVAFPIMLPWMLHVQESVGGLSMTGGGKSAATARNYYSFVAAAERGEDPADVVLSLVMEEPEILAAAGFEVPEIDDPEQARHLAGYYLQRIADAPVPLLATLVVKAWVAQFASGGGGNFLELFGLAADRPDKFMSRSDPMLAFFRALGEQALWPATITAISVAFAVALRALGLAGLVVLARRAQWPLLLVIAAVLAFKGAVHGFYGLSRYRLSVEPLLMILSVYGWLGIIEAIRGTGESYAPVQQGPASGMR